MIQLSKTILFMSLLLIINKSCHLVPCQTFIIRIRVNLLSTYAKLSKKIIISYLLIRTRTCAYQGVWDVCFSGNGTRAGFELLPHPPYKLYIIYFQSFWTQHVLLRFTFTFGFRMTIHTFLTNISLFKIDKITTVY